MPNLLRDIIEIDEELCNGCGICVEACHESALQIIDGKAKLVNEIFCDGLGDCLKCPEGALKIIKRKAKAFDEKAVEVNLKKTAGEKNCSCQITVETGNENSVLNNWPIQLKLVSPKMPFFDVETIVLAADCTAFSGLNFHKNFMEKKYPLIIACPKLDDNTDGYIDKLAEILSNFKKIKEVILIIMTVPCCSGLAYMLETAVKKVGREIAIKAVTVSPTGEIVKK